MDRVRVAACGLVGILLGSGLVPVREAGAQTGAAPHEWRFYYDVRTGEMKWISPLSQICQILTGVYTHVICETADNGRRHRERSPPIIGQSLTGGTGRPPLVLWELRRNEARAASGNRCGAHSWEWDYVCSRYRCWECEPRD